MLEDIPHQPLNDEQAMPQISLMGPIEWSGGPNAFNGRKTCETKIVMSNVAYLLDLVA
jgi:hypothetical protein